MKKLIFPLILSCLLLLGTACSNLLPDTQDGVLAEVAGQDVRILFDEDSSLPTGTVESGHGTYSFQYDENDDLTIQYPDGKTFRWTAQQGDWPYSEKETALGFFPGADLAASLDLASGAEARRTPVQAPSSGVPPIISVVLAAIGLWLLLSPMGVWKLFVESFRPEAEPQKRSLLIFRIVGAVLTCTGCALLFF